MSVEGARGRTKAEEQAEAVLGGYLAAVARRLPGRRATRRDVLDELRDGLLEATTAYERDGLTPAAAATAAVAEFGPPREVAAAHAGELLLAQARHGAWWVLGLLVAAGAWWQVYRAWLSPPLEVWVPADGWPRAAFLVGTEAIKVLPFVSQLGAVAVLLATFRGRFATLTERRWLARLAYAVAATAAATVATVAVMLLVPSPMPLSARFPFGLPTLAASVWMLTASTRTVQSCHTLARTAPTQPARPA
jgi:hypothetical protein